MQQQPPPYAASLMANDPKMAEILAANREFILADGALSAKVKTLMTMLWRCALGARKRRQRHSRPRPRYGRIRGRDSRNYSRRLPDGRTACACYRRQRLQGRIAAARCSPYRLCANRLLIDAPRNRLAVQRGDDVVRGHLPHAPNRLAACARYVRREQHVFKR